jgi:hypothetical protein
VANAWKALSLTSRTLYAELRELALAVGATENIGELPGSLVRKKIRGGVYLYHQYRDLAGATRQTYLGTEDEETLARWEQLIRRRAEAASDSARLSEIAAAFTAAGGAAFEHAPFRVVKAFADSGVLRPGPGHAVLVGTHAFVALGNLLGVRWTHHTRTQDLDVAADADVEIAVPRPELALPDVLDALEMGFIPVPSLHPRNASTSFRVRGQELRVDLLTPLRGRAKGKPVFVPALNAKAQPLRFLDYLLDEALAVPIFSRTQVALVNVPQPARFALHKLLVSESRDVGFATKAEKDRFQAANLLEVLKVDHPASIRAAKRALDARGRGWTTRVEKALRKLGPDAPSL